ncbi:MAG TPA: hypothetical protein VF066_03445 [Thermoleophilaceae bacterium]
MADDSAPANGTAPTVQLDDEGKRLALDEKKAQLRKGIAEARKAAVTAALPTVQTKGPEGKVDIGDDTGLVGRLVAYAMLDDAADIVANAIEPKGVNARVLLVKSRELLADDWAYELLSAQLRHHSQALTDALGQWPRIVELEIRGRGLPADDEEPEPGPGAEGEVAEEDSSLLAAAPLLGAVPMVIDSVLSIAALFRTRYSLAGKAMTIGQDPLLAEIAGKLIKQKREVTVEGFEFLRTGVFEQFIAAQRLRAELAGRVLDAKTARLDRADKKIASKRAAIERLEARIDKLIEGGGDANAIDALEQRVAHVEQEIEQIEDTDVRERTRVGIAEEVIAAFDTFSTSALSGDTPPLVAAALRERLDADAKSGEGFTHLVYASVEGAAAESLTQEKILGNGKVAFLGGFEVSWFVLNVAENKLVKAGAQPVLASVRYDLEHNEVTAPHRASLYAVPEQDRD